MREDAHDVERAKVFRAARVNSQRGRLDDYIDFLSENMELFEFVNKLLQQSNSFLAGFDAVLRTLLKANPERRPEKAVVEVPRQARDHELVEWPDGRIVHEACRES